VRRLLEFRLEIRDLRLELAIWASSNRMITWASGDCRAISSSVISSDTAALSADPSKSEKPNFTHRLVNGCLNVRQDLLIFSQNAFPKVAHPPNESSG
jgi:hypothetical protein